MLAVRRVQDVIDGAVTVQLPADFTARRVEVIVLPVETVEDEPTRLQELLLTAPVISEDELQGFRHVREWMNEWTVHEF
ncbi:MAG: hypothetical protein HC802_10665 [Caldilineaceae bacterium]|nr:hypothetical protein [Caldilineaceae bacterium]